MKERNKGGEGEYRDKVWHSWGVMPEQGEHSLNQFECPNPQCQHEFSFSDQTELFAALVGYSESPPCLSKRPDANFALVFECPDCFEKFWWHANTEIVAYFRESSPNWPAEKI